MDCKPAFAGVVEGDLDAVVLQRVVQEVGAELSQVYGRVGRERIRQGINGYVQAAEYQPWVVLVDLEKDPCAPALKASWVPSPSRYLCFRVVVRSIESWLMADRENLSAFLAVPLSRIPRLPEQVEQPKQVIVGLARQSARRAIRDDMVPRDGSGRLVGPGYNARLMEFAQRHWDPQRGAQRAPSLEGLFRCLRRILEALQNG